MKLQPSINHNELNRDERLPGTSYETIWERLPEALQRVMAMTGATAEDAKRNICLALAEGAIKIRCQLNRHATRGMTSNAVLDGTDFQIPPSIKSGDMEWEISRPTRPWPVNRGAYALPGYWQLAWLELSRRDVTALLCGNVQLGQVSPSNSSKHHRKHAADSKAIELNRRRGRRPMKRDATIQAMQQELRVGSLTAATLNGMLEKELAERFGVSRDTARNARKTVLSTLNSRQMPTNDK